MRTLSKSQRSLTMLTGFISLEEVHPQRRSRATSLPSATATSWKRRRSMLSSLTQQKWVYGVFQHDTLRCYRRRTDMKLNREPFRIVLLDLEATFVSERQSLIVQSRATGKTLRLRVHPSSSSTYVQWVTALYLARLNSSGSSSSLEARGATTTRAKRVTFNECICSLEYCHDLPTTNSTWRESIDLGDLFYSRQDIEGFRQSHRATKETSITKPLAVGRKVVQSIVSRLQRRGPLGQEREP